MISLTGSYIHTQENEAWNNNRFIFAEVVAVLGVLFSLLFLLPTMRRFIHFPVDFLLFVLFMTSYGLAVNVNSATSLIFGQMLTKAVYRPSGLREYLGLALSDR